MRGYFIFEVSFCLARLFFFNSLKRFLGGGFGVDISTWVEPLEAAIHSSIAVHSPLQHLRGWHMVGLLCTLENIEECFETTVPEQKLFRNARLSELFAMGPVQFS